MRKTKLKKATVITAAVLLSAAVALGVIRARFLGADPIPGGKGATLFAEKGCSQCHYTDTRDKNIGPGLQGILTREELPASGRKTTPENIRRQILDPLRNMPSFAGRLTEEQIGHLIDYLKTL
jgi:cytochrome c2